MQFIFGAGEFFGVPLSDAQGNPITNPTPIRIGAMQEMSLDLSGDLKELYGQKQFALAVARGKVKASGKFTGAQVHGAALNSLFFGTGAVAGAMKAIYTGDAASVIAGDAAPFTVTVAPPNGGTFVEDMGVLDASALPMTRVAGTPSAGQYSVSAAGVYTFASADISPFISYTYTYTSQSSKRISLDNVSMGMTPTFKALMQTSFRGKKALVELSQVTSTKLGLFATKLDDFSIPSVEFSASADDSGTTLGNIYIQE